MSKPRPARDRLGAHDPLPHRVRGGRRGRANRSRFPLVPQTDGDRLLADYAESATGRRMGRSRSGGPARRGESRSRQDARVSVTRRPLKFVGASLTAGGTGTENARLCFGGIPKRPTGADCKSAGLRLRWDQIVWDDPNATQSGATRRAKGRTSRSITYGRYEGRKPPNLEDTKRPTGADCKSAGSRLRWFESTSLHQQDQFHPVVQQGGRGQYPSRFAGAGVVQW